MERGLITKDIWKKPLHQNMIGRECRHVRGLAGLPRAAAEVPRDFSGQGVPPEKRGV